MNGHVIAATLDASFYRLQGASGQHMRHGHSHLIPYGSNNQSGPIEVASSLNSSPTRHDFATETLIVDPLYFEARLARNGRGALDTLAAPLKAQSGGTGKGDAAGLLLLYPYNQITSPTNGSNPQPGDPCPTLSKMDCSPLLIPGVRRITPMEAERLQGFPDGYTAIPKAADGPRYKIMGNSMATDVIAWLGRRIDDVDKQMKALKQI